MSNLVAVDGIPAPRLAEICRAEQEGRLVVLPEGLTAKQYACLRWAIAEDIAPICNLAAQQEAHP